MRTETAEAFVRLVTSYVSAIEGAGVVIPDHVVAQLTVEPLKACEALNELALAYGCIDDVLDAALAAVYENMDAADARGPVDEYTATDIARAWTRTHVEPEPETEPEPESVEDDEVWSSYDEESSPAEEQTEEQAEEPAEEKPAKKRTRKSKKAKAAEATAEGEEPTAEEPVAESHAVEEPTAGVPEAAPKAEAKPEAPAAVPAASAEDETLSVDQVSAILGISRPAIYKLIESGELPAGKKGRSWRISAAAVAARAAAN
jgi:excisionase family DNA binding protein